MKLEDQVAPLKLALKMKELGFPQETEFVWAGVGTTFLNGVDVSTPEVVQRLTGQPIIVVPYVGYDGSHGLTFRLPIPHCAAPTVAEMGEWLREGTWSVRLLNGRWTSGRARKERGKRRPMMGSTTEAETRARMLLAAVALGQIDLAALNSRA
jgi:hypothetical protein